MVAYTLSIYYGWPHNEEHIDEYFEIGYYNKAKQLAIDFMLLGEARRCTIYDHKENKYTRFNFVSVFAKNRYFIIIENELTNTTEKIELKYIYDENTKTFKYAL